MPRSATPRPPAPTRWWSTASATDDLVTGYSDYGSLGEYNIAGTVIDPGMARPPVAAASATPTSGAAPLIVAFSGSGSYDPDGRIESYAWDFGDGGSATGSYVSHTYAAKKIYTATLTVTDNTGWTDSADVVITVTGPPAAPDTLTATAASSSLINLTWADRSDDETGFVIERSGGGSNWAPIATVGANVTSYANTGLTAGTTYQYRVTATNSDGASSYSNTASATTQAASGVHIGDLDGTRSVGRKNWSAKVTISVHSVSHGRVSGAVVTGTWSTGAAVSCTTGSKGTCTVSASGIPLGTASVDFTVSNVAKSGSAYAPADNHDPDGESTGTKITITK